jgi:hypothetical protein
VTAGGELATGRGRHRLWPHAASQRGRGIGVQAARGAAWDQVGKQHMKPVARLGAGPDQVVAAVRQPAQDPGVVLDTDLAKPSGALGGHRDRDRVVGSLVRPWPTDSSRTRAASLAGPSTTCSPWPVVAA